MYVIKENVLEVLQGVKYSFLIWKEFIFERQGCNFFLIGFLRRGKESDLQRSLKKNFVFS